MQEIDKNFKTERLALGLTQQDAGVLLNVSRITYIKWETQPDTMPIGKYEKILNEFKRLRELREAE